MTLEERIAEAIKGTRAYQAAAAFGVPKDAHDECARGIARAVVAVLPSADVSDEAITEALGNAPCYCRTDYVSLSSPYSDGDDGRERECPHHGDGDPRNLTPTVRALLDQAVLAALARQEGAK